MEKPAHHEHIDRVGRELYGDLWIGELGTEEWNIGKDNGADHYVTAKLPSSGKAAATVARAFSRSRTSWEQHQQVFRWLNEQGYWDLVLGDLRGMPRDLTPGTPPRPPDFLAWFREKFPDAPLSPAEKRMNAVQAAWDAGQRPGHGGNIDWKAFHKDIETSTGLTFNLKTIQRDVRAIKLRGK